MPLHSSQWLPFFDESYRQLLEKGSLTDGLMGCGQSKPPPNPELIGLWVSDDATNVPGLLANFESVCRQDKYKVSIYYSNLVFQTCSGAVLEIEPDGYTRYLEMEGKWARLVYSGPILEWTRPDGVWVGCCAGCCCPKGCVHFTTFLHTQGTGISLTVNDKRFSKHAIPEKTNLIPSP